MSGKSFRLKRLFKDNKALVIAMDSYEDLKGPSNLNYVYSVLEGLLVIEMLSGIILDPGIVDKLIDRIPGDKALIVRADSKTRIKEPHKLKVKLIIDVEEALALGADAILNALYIGSEYEDETIENTAFLARYCRRFGLPLITEVMIACDEKEYEMLPIGIKLASEIGANIIKIPYIKSIALLEELIDISPVPILVCERPGLANVREILEMAYNSIHAGASGIVVGKSIWKHEDPVKLVEALGAIVYDNITIEEALKIAM